MFRHFSRANLNRFVREREADKRTRFGKATRARTVGDNRERSGSGSGDAARCYAVYKLANKKRGGEFEG